MSATILTCFAIDDEPFALDVLQHYVEKFPYLKWVGASTDGLEGIKKIEEIKPKILFLDIQMPDLMGFDLLQRLQTPLPSIIFTTAYSEFGAKGFDVGALDYLLKPIDFERFEKSILKAKTQYEQLHPPVAEDSIYIKSGYQTHKILIEQILYLEGFDDYVKIYVENQARPLLMLGSLKSMLDKLPEQKFARIHRSYILNVAKISVLRKNMVIALNREFPIGESYRDEFLKRFEGAKGL